MSTVLYKFEHSGNDAFIDFLKGVSIILVILSHTLPHHLTFFPIWGGSKAVPIFLAIQIFHAFKKGNPKIPNFKKIFNRVILPFIIFQCLIFIFLINVKEDVMGVVRSTILNGGKGPGAYYIYVYIQFALILPLVYKCLNKYKTQTILLITIIISVLLEVLSSCVNMPDFIYRLLAIRYFFLIYFGFLWVREGVVFGTKEIILGIIGFVSVLYFKYFYKPLEPLFFDTVWRTDRWICYFFVMYLFVPLLFVLWKHINHKIKNLIQFLGTCSFEIFLMQMFLCVIVPNVINNNVDNRIIASLMNILIIQIISVCGGVVYYKIKNKLTNC